MERGRDVFEVRCFEPEGEVVRHVKSVSLEPERLRFYWEKLREFKTLFNRHIRGLDDFIATFVSEDPYGNLKANGLIWEVDDVGIVYMTDIYPSYQATGHFSFWDRRLKGREPIARTLIKHVFDEFGFHRVITEVPLYSFPTIIAAERIGFVKEGRLRKAAWYKGEWWDVNLYSILEGEIDELLAAGNQSEAAKVTSDSSE